MPASGQKGTPLANQDDDMRRTSAAGATPRNHLLEALLRASPNIASHADRLEARTGAQLVIAGRPLKRLLFPTTGVIAVVARLSEGVMSEVQTVGNEGMVGLSAWFGTRTSIETAIVQASGQVITIPTGAFREAAARSDSSNRLLAHYAAYSLAYTRQTCVCNARHSVQQRVCRWLLSSIDRAASPILDMTQSMVAEMVSSRRQTTSEILVQLKRAGILALSRNRIEARDTAALEARSCECYRETVNCYRTLVKPLL
jgi:CRP-like cAMP-binding protein